MVMAVAMAVAMATAMATMIAMEGCSQQRTRTFDIGCIPSELLYIQAGDAVQLSRQHKGVQFLVQRQVGNQCCCTFLHAQRRVAERLVKR